MSLLDKANKLNHKLQKYELLLGVIFLGIMFVVMITNIFCRYVLYKPIFFSDELNNYLFIWLGFLGAAYIMGNDGHVKVTALTSLLNPKIQCVLRIVMDVIMLGVFVYYIIPSIEVLPFLKKSNMMRIPLKYIYLIMPISFILMSIHIVLNIIKEIDWMSKNNNKTDIEKDVLK